MAFEDPLAPLIRRKFATDIPPNRRIEILSSPGNSIDFYSGLAAETAPGHLNVDSSGTNSIMEVAAPQNAVTTNNALTKWTNDTTSNQSAIYNQADFFTIKTRNGQTQFTDDANGVATFSNLDAWHEVGALGEPAFNSTWVNFGGAGVPTLAFRKLVSGMVVFKGRIKGPAAVNPVFVLPTGYIPGSMMEFALKSNNDAGTISWIQIQPTTSINPGQVNVVGNVAAAQVFLSMNQISFLAEG